MTGIYNLPLFIITDGLDFTLSKLCLPISVKSLNLLHFLFIDIPGHGPVIKNKKRGAWLLIIPLKYFLLYRLGFPDAI